MLTTGEAITLLGFLLTLIAFIAGLFQYRQGQRWKALEFVSSQIKEFLKDQDVQHAMQMLDYNQRAIDFPLPADTGTQIKRVLVSDELVISALTSHLERNNKPVSDDEVLIRQTFDTFFDYLSQFNHYIAASGLVDYRDFHPYLSYWLAILCDDTGQRKPPRFNQQLHKYLDAYDYAAVKDLCSRYRSRRAIR